MHNPYGACRRRCTLLLVAGCPAVHGLRACGVLQQTGKQESRHCRQESRRHHGTTESTCFRFARQALRRAVGFGWSCAKSAEATKTKAKATTLLIDPPEYIRTSRRSLSKVTRAPPFRRLQGHPTSVPSVPVIYTCFQHFTLGEIRHYLVPVVKKW